MFLTIFLIYLKSCQIHKTVLLLLMVNSGSYRKEISVLYSHEHDLPFNKVTVKDSLDSPFPTLLSKLLLCVLSDYDQ